MDVIEAMETCIAMRYLKEDVIPEADLERLIYAATRASSPGNSQEWEFVVLNDAAIKAEIGDAVWAAMAPVFDELPDADAGSAQRMYKGAAYLAKNFAKVPAWILGCARKNYPPQAPTEAFMHSTIYPAAQNLIVAARSMGLGTTFTTFQMAAEPVIRERLSIPAEVQLCVLVAVGYPEKAFAPVRRKPVSEVLHWNTW
ncbi:MAG: nitroreductase [Gammaproteobacteria bacterium]|jgi:nitroreductase